MSWSRPGQLQHVVSLGLALAAWVMTYITVDELIPVDHEFCSINNKHYISTGLLVGMIFGQVLSTIITACARADKTPKIDKIPEQRTFEDILKEMEKKFVENDRVSLSLKELWAILRTYKNDFTDVYNALISAYGEQKDAIDEIFKTHGFWIDENVGDRMWDRNSEPIRDTVDDARLDENDYFIDYPSAGFIYDENEIIGSSGNYQRKNRTSIVYFPGHFIKVDNSVPSYTVTIGVFTNPDLFGLIPDQIYEINCQNLDGYIFVPVPPESYNSTIAVMPDEVEAEVPMIFTSRDFEEHYDESIEQGYFREHNFAIEEESSEPEPTPQPEPEPEEEPDKPGGIPGFGFDSVLIGVVLSMLAMWLMSRRSVYSYIAARAR